jgi:hypothetical protein
VANGDTGIATARKRTKAGAEVVAAEAEAAAVEDAVEAAVAPKKMQTSKKLSLTSASRRETK